MRKNKGSLKRKRQTSAKSIALLLHYFFKVKSALSSEMPLSFFGKISAAIIGAIILFSIFNVFTSESPIDLNETLKDIKEEPVKTGTIIFIYSQTLGAVTPAWRTFGSKPIYILHYPINYIFCLDYTLILFLAVWMLLVIFIIKITPMREKFGKAFLFYVIMLVGGYVVWQVVFWYAYLASATSLGISIESATGLWEQIINRSAPIILPLFVLTILGLAYFVKVIPHKID